MIKLLGAVLILFAGTMIGFQQAARLAARPRQLRQLAHALQRLETEIGYGHTPLPEALERTAEAVPEPLAELFRDTADRVQGPEGLTFRESWEQAMTSGWGLTALRQTEQSVMLRLGSTLGISDKEDQLKHIHLALLQLKAEEDTAREDQSRYEKMWKSLGVLIAVLVVILMV
ncbi:MULTISPECIES: stage III sporulation protein SpoIIIAB [Paenibacillus]|uniref:Stage III sporulation protein SpoAB n=1 Tax=Paenibacillus glycanilyticus TaxID=126569 RepID=A0ABQ6NMM8_9BACL|nr:MULTISPECIES: stage III sporulation protein SpoIIIAB [Paenibacillus]MCK9857299.1 stage III sporulation protein SpoIIIAB [Paenibacillus sp. ATY16]GMK46336.1 stage III sporulation protein SpoAB [Paenibacillus glycanilyticus]